MYKQTHTHTHTRTHTHTGRASGAKGKFKMPCVVTCYGPPDPDERSMVCQELFSNGVHLTQADPMALIPSSQGQCGAWVM
jgi:hypothetical protein